MNRIEQAFKDTRTDKRVHKYYEYYDALFGDQEFKSILEIGVLKGRSLFAWQQVWPSAVVEGVDIDLNLAEQKTKDQFKIYDFDSTQEVDKSIFTLPSYDLIVDDGHHHWSSQRSTFDNFYPMANQFYVIEDLQGVYGLNKVLEYVRKHSSKKVRVFESRGPSVKFNFTNYTEFCPYKIIIIDKR